MFNTIEGFLEVGCEKYNRLIIFHCEIHNIVNEANRVLDISTFNKRRLVGVDKFFKTLLIRLLSTLLHILVSTLIRLIGRQEDKSKVKLLFCK